MSKKTKRQMSSSKIQEVMPAAAKTTTPVTSNSGEWNPDYSYVATDLKKIGIMAGSFFVVLIVLSFFLR